MILSLLLPLLCPPATPARLPFCHPALQEPAPETDSQEEKLKPKKEKFARLTSPNKKVAQKALRLIEKGEKEEEVAEGVAQLLELGEAVIPLSFDAVKRMDGTKGLDSLWTVLDTILVEDDLELAWNSLQTKHVDALRIYLVRRWAESSLKESKKFLTESMTHENPELAYQAARGLALRGVASAVPAIEAQVAEKWLKESVRIRADFAGVKRGPLVSEITPLLQRKHFKEKLTAIRMFELFGVEEQAKLLAPFLSESDTTLRLAAINACRVIISKEEPLDRPSMTEIIERAEAWKAKL
ncbi:MAG: hypothetical protein O3A50_09600 [Planctomycetota bacterium]|nr:hypothetical protein [Planctomycetota bacterium]